MFFRCYQVVPKQTQKNCGTGRIEDLFRSGSGFCLNNRDRIRIPTIAQVGSGFSGESDQDMDPVNMRLDPNLCKKEYPPNKQMPKKVITWKDLFSSGFLLIRISRSLRECTSPPSIKSISG